jgi:hypothetical protein
MVNRPRAMNQKALLMDANPCPEGILHMVSVVCWLASLLSYLDDVVLDF